MILNCLERKPLPIYGEGTNVRDWLYVDDHAKALWMLLEKGKKGETYNVGGESEWRNVDVVNEIVRIIADLQGENVDSLQKLISYVKDRPGHDFRYAIDCSKIKEQIGWTPEHQFQDALKKTIVWYMENMDWVDGIKNGSYRNWVDLNYVNR